MAKVYVKFPKTGLGNMLLVWANALVFAKINNMELIKSSWWGIHWGSLLRRENKSRMYVNYFYETPLFFRITYALKYLFFKKVSNPQLKKIASSSKELNNFFVFDKVVTHERLFFEFENFRNYISEELYLLLTKNKKEELSKYANPEIAIHIRRGDFILTGQTTSLSFFIKSVEAIRKGVGYDVPVTVFTDATHDELKEIFTIPLVSMSQKKADILDILLMSKSKFLVLSQSSTFSYWAAFLSEAFVVIKHDDWQAAGIKLNHGKYMEVRCNVNDIDSLSNL